MRSATRTLYSAIYIWSDSQATDAVVAAVDASRKEIATAKKNDTPPPEQLDARVQLGGNESSEEETQVARIWFGPLGGRQVLPSEWPHIVREDACRDHSGRQQRRL